MHRQSLSGGIIWRMLAWGTISGPILGFYFGSIVAFLGGSRLVGAIGLVSCVYGAIAGFALGLIDGIALAIVTHIVLRRAGSPNTYRLVGFLTNIVLTAFGAQLWFDGFLAGLNAIELWGWILYAVVPTLIAIVVAWIATARIIAWVENTVNLGGNEDNR